MSCCMPPHSLKLTRKSLRAAFKNLLRSYVIALSKEASRASRGRNTAKLKIEVLLPWLSPFAKIDLTKYYRRVKLGGLRNR